MRVASYLIVFFLLAAVSGCGSPAAEEQAEVTASAEDTSAMQLYKKNCISCHGNDLSGRVGPSLQQAGSRLTEEQIGDIIKAGARGMPGYEKSLKTEEISQLAKWLSAKKE